MNYKGEVEYLQSRSNEITRFRRDSEIGNDDLKLTGYKQQHWSSDSMLNRMKCGNSSGSKAECSIHTDYITAVTRIISGTDFADVVTAGILNCSRFACCVSVYVPGSRSEPHATSPFELAWLTTFAIFSLIRFEALISETWPECVLRGWRWFCVFLWLYRT